MKSYLHIDILTPYGKYLSTESDFISLKTPVGVLGILPNHTPLISTVEISKLVIKCDNKENTYAVSGGVIHIKDNNQVVLLVNAIENKKDINLSRAEKAKANAEEMLKKDNADVKLAKSALLRALNRISIYNE